MEKILIIDDENDLCNLVADIVSEAGYKPIIALNEADAYIALKKHVIDLVLLDVSLTTGNQEGLNILNYCLVNLPFIPVIMISGHTSLDAAVDAVKQGAVDFLEKPFSRQKLIISIASELARAESRKVHARLNKFDYDTKLISQSAAMSELMQKVERVMHSASRIVILGDSGTGKNSLAYYIHSQTAKKTSRYYEVDCAQINTKTELMNALVGVNNANNGLLFNAVDGTLVLDNVEQINSEVQIALLQLLQQLNHKVSFKIITLANIKIDSLMETDLFKKELFMKLAGNLFELPLLKDRLDDLLPLIQKFSLPYNPIIPEELVSILKSHTWLGNLNELKNVIQQMLMKNTKELEVQNLVWKVSDISDPQMLLLSYRDAVQLFTQRYFAAQLNRADGNQTIAAENACVDRSTLYRRTGKGKKGSKHI